MDRDVTEARRVDPYHLLFQGGQFYLLGYAHEREAIRVFRLSRIRGKVSYATKAEHDCRRPAHFDPRAYARRADWQLGEERGVAEVLVSERIAWQIERHFGRYGEIRDAQEVPGAVKGDQLFETSYSNPRGVVSWVLGLGANATLQGPPELSRELARRLKLLKDRHGRTLPGVEAKATPAKANGAAVSRPRGGSRRAGAEEDEEGPGRPE